MNWRDMPSLSALRAFAALARTGSYTRAGESLNISHAAVSQHVRALEENLGVLLVQRDGRRSMLTPEGVRLAETVESGFAAIHATIEELRGVDTSRPLQISLTPAFGVRWLMPRISDFRHRHPEIELMLNPTAELVELVPGGVDIAIRFGRGIWPGLETEMLLPTSIAIVAAKSLVGERRIREPGDILDLPWLQEYGTNEMTLWMRNKGVLSPKPANLIHLPGYMLLDGLLNGDGVTAMTRVLVEPEIASGRLVVLFEERTERTGYHIVTRPGVVRPAARAFVSWLRQQARPGGARRAPGGLAAPKRDSVPT